MDDRTREAIERLEAINTNDWLAEECAARDYILNLVKRTEVMFNLIRNDLLNNTAYVTTGAVPVMSGYGFASIDLTGVVTKKNIERVLNKHYESLQRGGEDE